MLDIRQLRAKGLRFDIDGTGSYLWGDGLHAALAVTPTSLLVTFTVWGGYEKGYVPVSRDVGIAQASCHFGKTRPWLICPECGRRCVALAVSRPDCQLSCRVCAGLSYQTQSMSRQARIDRKIMALVDRLGLNESKWPPRVRQRTFERLMKRYEELAWGPCAETNNAPQDAPPASVLTDPYKPLVTEQSRF